LYLASNPLDLWERTEEDAAQGQQPPPFWAFPWAGGQALARYLLDHPGTVRGRTVLDLAAGSGLVALAAARAGAAAVTASEIDPLAMVAIGLNCAVNGVRLQATVGDVLDGDTPEADVVLAGDAFYERSTVERLLPFLERARKSGALVLVGDPSRAYLPRDRFEQVAIYQVPVSQQLEDADIKPTTIWRLA
jgi:predicted nicotinamide N-methyase